MSISQQSRADLQSRIPEWMDQQPSAGDVTELEEFALEVSQCVEQAVVEHGLNRADPTKVYRKSSIPCECGNKARFVNYRDRTIGTIYGAVAVQRAYYHCKHCGKGHVSWDREQRLNPPYAQTNLEEAKRQGPRNSLVANHKAVPGGPCRECTVLHADRRLLPR
ncbi:MAG: hypothetical protein HPY44_15840 [Armatimonadetes bacterium]|nr:hypothetical protein [Armatimonadota bacterium]